MFHFEAIAYVIVSGQVIFEMATGFPLNYADDINLDPGRKRLTLHRKEQLGDIHFEYLKTVSHPEVLQVRWICWRFSP